MIYFYMWFKSDIRANKSIKIFPFYYLVKNICILLNNSSYKTFTLLILYSIRFKVSQFTKCINYYTCNHINYNNHHNNIK